MNDTQRDVSKRRHGQDPCKAQGVAKKPRQSTKGLSAEEKAVFWSKVTKEKCWNFKSGDCVNGYYRIKIEGKRVMAHRISWMLHFGTIPDGMFVLHQCDNRSCVNPDHLFLGTIATNNKDRDNKGRHIPLFGTDNGLAKLNWDSVREIRSLSGKVKQREIAAQFGVSQKAIFMVIHNQTWKDEYSPSNHAQ